jgi:hypothetical protein
VVHLEGLDASRVTRWSSWRRHVVKIKITIDGKSFEFEGDVPFSEVRSLVDEFFKVQSASEALSQSQLDKLVERFKASNVKLASSVDANTPQ